MMYHGGKTRLAKELSEVMLSRVPDQSTYIEPFLGSAAVMAEMSSHFDESVGNDILEDVILMWGEVIKGWVPPENLSLEEYESLRKSDPSPLRGFAGTVCSFGGRWFEGYARDPKSSRNFARSGSKSIVNRGKKLHNLTLTHGDYVDLIDPLVGGGSVVYCDPPPYANTKPYSATGHFDHDRFWRTVNDWDSRGALVFVSEYTAPDDWEPIWVKDRHTSTSLNNAGKRAVDKLFVKNTI